MNGETTRKWARASLFAGALLASASASAQAPDDIVGMSIACSNDRVFTWYRDRHVTSGTSENLDARQGHQSAQTYSLPPGKTPDDIVGIGISKKDHVYTWYKDKTLSIGTSTDLDSRQGLSGYSLPPGKSPQDIVGIDIACSTDKVFTWYGSGTVSIGSSADLGLHQVPTSYSPAPGKSPSDLVELGIAGTKDRVYAWYRDRQASAGTSADLDSFRTLFRYAIVTPPCDIFANPPQGADRDFAIGIGSRGPSCASSAGITVFLMEDRRLQRDRLLDEKAGSGTNFDVTTRFTCSGRQGGRVYTKVKGVDRERESVRVNIQLCF